MIDIQFQGRTIHLPTDWFEITCTDALVMGELTIDAAILHYFGLEAASIEPSMLATLTGLLGFLNTDTPQVEYQGPDLLELSFYEWYMFTRHGLEIGIHRTTGIEIAALPWIEAAPILEHFNNEITKIDELFADLKEDIRSDLARQTQPPGFWDGCEDWIDFDLIDMPVNADRFAYMKTVPLLNYLQKQRYLHRVAKANKAADEALKYR